MLLATSSARCYLKGEQGSCCPSCVVGCAVHSASTTYKYRRRLPPTTKHDETQCQHTHRPAQYPWTVTIAGFPFPSPHDPVRQQTRASPTHAPTTQPTQSPPETAPLVAGFVFQRSDLLPEKASCLQRRRCIARRELRLCVVRTTTLTRLCGLLQPALPGPGSGKARLAPRRWNRPRQQLRMSGTRGRRHNVGNT